MVVQSFFAWRVFVLTRSWALVIVVALLSITGGGMFHNNYLDGWLIEKSLQLVPSLQHTNSSSGQNTRSCMNTG